MQICWNDTSPLIYYRITNHRQILYIYIKIFKIVILSIRSFHQIIWVIPYPKTFVLSFLSKRRINGTNKSCHVGITGINVVKYCSIYESKVSIRHTTYKTKALALTTYAIFMYYLKGRRFTTYSYIIELERCWVGNKTYNSYIFWIAIKCNMSSCSDVSYSYLWVIWNTYHSTTFFKCNIIFTIKI